MIGIEPSELVFVAEYCGGGFGGKASSYPLMALPALMSKKMGGRPALLRVSRNEEYDNGMARAGFQGYAKFGFADNGKLIAADVYVVQDLGRRAAFPTSTTSATRQRSSSSPRTCGSGRCRC